ncbi:MULTISPECIES: SCO4402 family protein [unclassified Microcoleus]|uniref:SCO4402 family protein n=1 Tax=unclassified Microcoleus TaxID=2642155 RepID=UPI002FD4659A
MVKYPKMREELLETLRSLADREYQHKVWLKNDYPAGIECDSFDEAVHFLYDDTVLAENPDAAIGVIIEDEKEARLISAVCQAIDLVFEALGTGVPDEEYIKSSEWTSVVEAASRALQAMKLNRRKRLRFKLKCDSRRDSYPSRTLGRMAANLAKFWQPQKGIRDRRATSFHQ